MDEQSEIIAFLREPGSYDPTPKTVERIETHGAMVFLAGDDVFKIKRCVKYHYMDFSTLEKRRVACARELEINQPQAPEIYLGLTAITREVDGSLAFDGKGVPVEWAVHMRRFAQEDILDHVALSGGLTQGLTRQLAEKISTFHDQAPRVKGRVSPHAGGKTLGGIIPSLKAFSEQIKPEDLRQFESLVQAQIKACTDILNQRAQSGFVRRCHGDLHLQNIVLIENQVTLFDAIEFDERLAEIDVLYDLAFLLMDLEHCGLHAQANFLLNHYLLKQATLLNYQGLKLMPLFLALRAAIRAMVTLHHGQAVGQISDDLTATAQAYFTQALDYLTPPPAHLVVVGGFSGTGKSTLAALLTAKFGAAPGALHLRSDLERKAMFQVEETQRLGADAYTRDATQDVYDKLSKKASLALSAGHSVVLDAVFSTREERDIVEAVAQDLGIGFTGLWLTAPEACLIERVGNRVGDASDATSRIVTQQLERGAGTIDWHMVDAGGTQQETFEYACEVLKSQLKLDMP